MGSAPSPEQKIRIKIGLIVLVIVFYFIGLFIYSLILKEKIDTQREEMENAYNVLSYSEELIITVQQAQDVLNMYLTAPRRRLQVQYDSLSENISQQISHIKSISPEKGNDLLLEDIDSLLLEKHRIVHRLTAQFRSRNPLTEIDRKIETYDDIIQDSIVVTTNKDTTVVATQQKGFWRRLKNLFDPQYAPDSTVTIAHTEQEARSVSRVDTVLYADLKQVTQEASKTYSFQIEGIEREVRELVFAEQSISLHISQLITRFYNEAIEITRQGTDNSEMLTVKIFTFALTVGAISILLILVIIFLIISDLNKGQKARIDLVREKQLTEELISSRHKLLLSVSHDIKTPLSSMMGYMEMWDSDELSMDKKRQLHSARNSGLHILSMLTNLLEFSRLESNKGTLHFSRFDLTELTNDIINMFQPFTEEKGLQLQFENRTTSPLFVETDYTVLKQILINLLSNAVKYTLQGSIHLKIEEEDQLIFTITDTGIGIDPEDIAHIFKPFSRIQNPLRAEGNGFGLYVTKGLVDSLRGTIAISSEKDQGTTVTISLPLVNAGSPDPKQPKTTTSVTGRRFGKILIFEDDASLGNMIREFLTQKGYKVKLCSSTRDVKGFIRLITSFDVVLTDMQMKDITGIDILREIRVKDANIPVWLMTAYDEYTADHAQQEGFAGLIAKPIQMARLLQILSGEEAQKQDASSLAVEFPQLTAMFDGDSKAIKEILSGFVISSEKDREALKELVHLHRFQDAQLLCHKIHPFYSQLDAGHLCEPLRKMDRLRGKEEDLYPQWKEELLEAIRQMKLFADKIKRDYL